jgi:hypothetical protein
MAIATYGDIITDLKGSIGGFTFQHNTAGKIVRLRPFRKKYNTQKQLSRQNIFYSLVRVWNDVLLSDKILWQAFAALHKFDDPFGASKTLTDLQWFISINTNLLLIGEPLTYPPPKYELPTSPPDACLILSSVSINLTVALPDAGGYDAIVITLTPPVTNSSVKLNGKFRLCHIIPLGLWVDINLTAFWEAYYGLVWSVLAPYASFQIACEIFCIDSVSGIASPVNRYIAIPAAAPFVPTDLPYLSLWLDASKGIVLDGANVERWNDQSGSGYYAIQNDHALQPLYVLNVIDGLPVVRWDGSGDMIFVNAFALAQPITVFVVGSNSRTAGGWFYDSSIRFGLANYATQNTLYAGTWLNSTIPSPLSISLISCVYNGANSKVWLNEVLKGSGNAGANSTSDLYIGNAFGGGGELNGDIAEILIYDAALSDVDRAKVENYLHLKYPSLY